MVHSVGIINEFIALWIIHSSVLLLGAADWSVTTVDITPDHTASRCISESSNLPESGTSSHACMVRFLILVYRLVRSSSIVLSFEFRVSVCVCV
jgi:hypothetical protein